MGSLRHAFYRLSLTLIACAAITAHAATYYVATDAGASDGNPGTQASPWRTIAHAVATVVAGDTVMIKGGNYGNEYITMSNKSGTASKPIVFEGYDGWPVLGTLPSPRTTPPSDVTKWGFRLYKSHYITLRNIKFTYYYNCLYVELSNYVTADNIYVNTSGSTGAAGTGIFWKYSNYGKILNCTVIDAGGNDVMLAEANYCLVDHLTCRGTLEDEDPYCTDYYFIMRCCNNTTVQNSYVEDEKKCDKGNHGFIIKDMDCTVKSYNNLIQDCTAIGVGECFAAAHGAYNNTFLRCHGNTEGKDNGISYIINCRNGAHGNTWREITGTSRHILIGLSDEAEGAYDVKYDNKFVNCVLKGTHGEARSLGVLFRRTRNNTFENCVLDNVDHLGRYIQTATTGDTNTGNAFKNCILAGMTSTYDPDKDITSFYPMGGTLLPYDGTGDLVVTYTDFWDNVFTALGGSGNMSADPLFADRTNRDYHLKSTIGRWNGSEWVQDTANSPCIDAGDPASSYASEPAPNGDRINIGGYGNTTEASMSPTGTPVTSMDNRLAERYPTTIYGNNTYLDIGHLANYDKRYRDLVWFDLSHYQNAALISKATLSLYWYFPSSTRTNDTVAEVYKPAAGWDHNYVCWVNKSSGVAWTHAGGDWYDRNGTAQGSTPYASVTFSGSQNATNQYYAFDVTDLVKAYIAGGQNPGFFIKARTENDNYIAFAALKNTNPAMRPKLELTLDADLWVDFSWAGAETGLQAEPFNTLVEGVGALTAGRTLHIIAGTTAETARITKPMRIVAENGTVRLGAAVGMASPPSRTASRTRGRNSAMDWSLYK
ncbi:DNRLRE domain-containing protein [bacterium]|nr:DNRLRE domain-containing protein [bacterium]